MTEDELAEVGRREQQVLDRRLARYRRGRDRVDLRGRTAIVVDDGVATGSTARAACRIARGLGASRVVLAVPVGPPDTLHHVPEADTVVAVDEPEDFRAVGYHYQDFSPTSDDEVVVLLDRASRRVLDDDLLGEPADCDIDVEFEDDGVVPAGPPPPSRAFRRRRAVRPRQRQQPPQSAQPVRGRRALRRRHRHVPPRPAHARRGARPTVRVRCRPPGPPAVGGHRPWVLGRREAISARIGYFGASTGAAAALVAAADRAASVSAVVSRGGRPDLALPRLPDVVTPTLLIVGGEDTAVLDGNRMALGGIGRPEAPGGRRGGQPPLRGAGDARRGGHPGP